MALKTAQIVQWSAKLCKRIYVDSAYVLTVFRHRARFGGSYRDRRGTAQREMAHFSGAALVRNTLQDKAHRPFLTVANWHKTNREKLPLCAKSACSVIKMCASAAGDSGAPGFGFSPRQRGRPEVYG
jgi:hypothetical protein